MINIGTMDYIMDARYYGPYDVRCIYTCLLDAYFQKIFMDNDLPYAQSSMISLSLTCITEIEDYCDCVVDVGCELDGRNQETIITISDLAGFKLYKIVWDREVSDKWVWPEEKEDRINKIMELVKYDLEDKAVVRHIIDSDLKTIEESFSEYLEYIEIYIMLNKEMGDHISYDQQKQATPATYVEEWDHVSQLIDDLQFPVTQSFCGDMGYAHGYKYFYWMHGHDGEFTIELSYLNPNWVTGCIAYAKAMEVLQSKMAGASRGEAYEDMRAVV